MQQDNNIENKLRQQEAMEQPDLSQMDTHWQQMQAVLQPGSIPMKKGWPKWMLNTLSVAAVVILIGVAMFYFSSKKDNSNENVVQKKETVAEQNNLSPQQNLNTNTVVPVLTDSIIKETSSPLIKLKINPLLIYNAIADTTAKKWTTQDSVLATVKLNYTPCETCPGKAVRVLSDAERKLGNLFAQLEKEEQHFVIDNSKDTLLHFKEGTVLLIPANSFNGMKGVEIRAKEFYKTSDIILNQLDTESDKGQLETGGMLYLQAIYKGNEVKINKNKPVALFMADTSSRMSGMQLFYKQNAIQANVIEEIQIGDTSSGSNMNWVATPQYFLQRKVVTQVWVFNIADIPNVVKEKGNKSIAYFRYDEDQIKIGKKELKKLLKEKYGYTKVRLISSSLDRFSVSVVSGTLKDDKFDNKYSDRIGDSVWMEKEVADKYKLNGTSSRQIVVTNNQPVNGLFVRDFSLYGINTVKTNSSDRINGITATDEAFNNLKSAAVINEISNKYGVSLNQLGWINCDRFYTDSRKKIHYKVDLGDSAMNYYTMLIFDNIQSMMTGYINGNEVTFQNIPVGEPVKVISIGINKKGETVYSVTHTTTSEEELKGLQFQSTSAPDLKASLGKLDK